MLPEQLVLSVGQSVECRVWLAVAAPPPLGQERLGPGSPISG